MFQDQLKYRRVKKKKMSVLKFTERAAFPKSIRAKRKLIQIRTVFFTRYLRAPRTYCRVDNLRLHRGIII